LNPTITRSEAERRELTTEAFSPSDEHQELSSSNGQEAFTLSLAAMTVWRDRRFIIKVALYGLIIAAMVSLLIPPEYQSTLRMMPPEKQSLGGIAAVLASMGDDKTGGALDGLASDALGIRSSGALFIGVLKSSRVQDSLINQFDLRKVYRVRYQRDARERLSQRTAIEEDRKSGIISIGVTDRSPQRAAAMARAYSDTLGHVMAELNTSSAHRERLFLEDRLQQVKQDLDTASNDLSRFSSQNLTLDVKEQGKAMMAGVAALEGELIAAESQLSGLEQIYAPNNIRVRSLQGRVSELRRKLAELRGDSSDLPDAADHSDFGISIAKMPALGVAYYDLYRRVKVEEAVFEILTKQYELAKIEEAKSLPTIKVLDEAQVPETKTSPKRTLMTLGGAFLAALLAIMYTTFSSRWKMLPVSHPANLYGLEIKTGLAHDWTVLRSRIPTPIREYFTRVATRLSRKNEPPLSD
jgi:uncharacterized protein involved in exopolysaccharide biosynthesis